jgi:hypothetical protein
MHTYNILSIPSFYAHLFNAFIIMVSLLLFITNYKKIDSSHVIIITLLFSISIGIHGISHLGLENTYEYNPLIDMKRLM